MSRIALILLFRRTLLAIPILLCVSALVFVVLRLLPADPIAMSLPPGATRGRHGEAAPVLRARPAHCPSNT